MSDKLLTDIYRLCASELERIIEHASRDAAGALFKMLEAADDWASNDFSLAVNLLESNHEWLAHKVSDSALKALKGVSAGAPVEVSEPELTSLDDLSIVSKDAFEDWLVVNTAIKAVERETSYELTECCQIMSALKHEKIDEEELAIGPHRLLSEAKRAIDQMELPAMPQTVIYKAVSKSLSRELKALYAQVSVLANRENLKFKPDTSKPPVTRAPVSRESNQAVQADAANQATQEPVPAESGGQQKNAGQIKTLNALTRLNASLSSGNRLQQASGSGLSEHSTHDDARPVSAEAFRTGSEGAAGSVGTVVVPPSQLISVISEIQKKEGTVGQQEVASLRNWLESGISQSGTMDTSSIGTQESELIDVTDRFFDVIVDKIGVSGVLKKWLEKLKVTILKIVLKDDSFFSDASHPARQLLNKLAKLASNDQSSNKRLESLLNRHIEKIVSEYDENNATVENVVSQLNVLLERQEKAYQRNSERIARTYEGKQRIAEARTIVVKDLNDRLAERSVPLIVMELLDKAGWREHLSLTIVRDGISSEEYVEALGVIDQLLSWFGSSPEQEDHWAVGLEMELEAPSLFEMVAKELSASGLVGSEGILKRLEDCLFNDVEPLLINIEKYEWPYDKSEEDLEVLQPVEADRSSMTHWHKSILSMKIGDWIEIKDDSGRTRSLRLAWSGSESFRFVFVDSQGMKDEDVSLKDLVAMFKNNQASFVENSEVPLVDQGLHQMVQSVYEELSSQSSCDVLTGLLNRQAFERAIEQSIAAAISRQEKAVILYIDLDKFSLTNTNYGHLAGDAVLKHVAEIVRDYSKEGTFCGRLGGNEYGVILPTLDAEQALEIAENIREEVATTKFIWEGHTIQNTVSIGVVPLDIEMDSYDVVMRKAALACETAKSQGHNRCVTYTKQDKDQKKRDEMLQWVQKLDDSLDDLLTLRCQEIRPNDPSGSRQSHWEILLGVKQDGQVLPPGMLIEAAEHFDRMAKVDRWVFHNVLIWMENHQHIVDRTDGFSINLSGNSLSDDTFLEFVMGEFSASSVPPEKICFEITETAAIANIADVAEFVRLMKQKGCKFSLDDFGSGLSSYAYIQKLPVDYIKIDGIFIRNIVDNKADQALVRSINELAHFMGMQTVAEFVENHDILNVLSDIGVDNSQGYGIKKPGLLSDMS